MAYVPVKPPYRNRPESRLVGIRLQRGFVFGMIMVAALVAFELFNFSTTEYALNDLLGGAKVLNVGWASVLAVAFCAIDFAGLARLFTPEQGRDEPKEVWYLMGAWFLGAAANAVMTWWAITLALLPRPLGNEVLSREQLLTYVPIFVAALVWLTRILIIGTFGIAGERVFTLGSGAYTRTRSGAGAESRDRKTYNRPQQIGSSTSTARPRQTATRTSPRPFNAARSTPNEELVYEPVEPAHSASSPPPHRPPYGYSYTRPAPKPNGAPHGSYGYSTAPGYYSSPKSVANGESWLHRARVDEEVKT